MLTPEGAGGEIMSFGARVSAERPRLEDGLARLQPGGLAIIAGSAGYGKSSAVTTWAIQQPTPARWMRGTLDLVAALRNAAEEDDGAWLPRLGRVCRKPISVEQGVAALIADLGAPHANINFVIDNADELASTVEGLELLRAIAERNPDAARVILIGRRGASLRLAVARSKRSVIEMGAPALRISPQQSRQIAESRGYRGTPADIESARRASAGNGGVLAAWASSQVNGRHEQDLLDYIRREVVGSSELLLRRLTSGTVERPAQELLESLWTEGLLLAPQGFDDLGSDGWRVPELIARAISVIPKVQVQTVGTSEIATSNGSLAVQDRRVVIHDLGPLVMECGGRTIEGTAIRPRSLALLIYLATRPRHSATRDEVIAALWPDAEPQAGLNSLNQAIYHLRRTIEPDYDPVQDGRDTGYVRHESEVVSMNLDLVSFDSARLISQLNHIRLRPRAEVLDLLLDMYHGPFGSELPYEPWVQRYHSLIEISLLTTVERAVLAAHDARDYDRAINLAARATRIDPEDGALLERLAVLLEEDGAIAGAKRAARRAMALLADMDVRPSEELRRLGSAELDR